LLILERRSGARKRFAGGQNGELAADHGGLAPHHVDDPGNAS
jgi:hypothetical protein